MSEDDLDRLFDLYCDQMENGDDARVALDMFWQDWLDEADPHRFSAELYEVDEGHEGNSWLVAKNPVGLMMKLAFNPDK